MPLVTDRPDAAARPSASPRWRPTRLHRVVVAALVAMGAFRFEILNGGIIEGEVDPSWWIGLGWMRDEGFDFGSDTLFTYGPLGLLAEPSWASSRFWIAVALLASAAVAGWFGWVVVRAVRVDAHPGWAVTSALGLGLLAGWSLRLPELAVLALAIDVYTRLPSNADRPPSTARLAGYGALAGLMALGKVSTAVIGAVAVVVLGLSWAKGAERWKRLGVVAAAGTGALVLAWVVTGNEPGALPAWTRGSFELIRAYGTSMTTTAVEHRWNNTELAIIGGLLAALLFVQVVRGRRVGWRLQLPESVLMALMAWFTVKAGLVRFDHGHVNLTLVSLATWIVVTARSLQWRVVPVVVVIVAGFGLATSYATGTPSDADVVVEGRWEQPGQVATALRALASPSAHAEAVEDAKADLRAFYADESGLSAPILAALDGERVYADGWDIAALWAHDLDWQTLPVLQGYSAYSEWLDERNADAVRDETRGPTAILRRARNVDFRWGPWDTPATQLAITCSFETVATDGQWSALHRAPDTCGEPRRIGEVRAEPGEPIEVPTAGPSELVVATFDVDPSLGKRALDLLARDPELGIVVIGDRRWRFLPTTGGSLHIVNQPDRVGDRDLPGTALEVEDLRFVDLGGPVDVTFYAVPLR